MRFIRPQIRRVLSYGLLIAASVGSAFAQRVEVAAKAQVPSGWVDAGMEPASSLVDGIVITLRRSETQQADLNSFLNDVTQPGTPSFHKWMTPAQFAERFQPAQTQVDAVTDWLTAQGFSIDEVSPSRTRIRVHGTVEVTQRAFGTQLRQLQNEGKLLRVASSALTLPMAVASQVDSVEGVSLSEISAETLATWSGFATKVEANTDAVLTLRADAVCGASSASALSTAYVPVLEQAAAQGITVLVSGNCVGTALPPGATTYATAVRAAGETAKVSLAADGEARPVWQSANGLPDAKVRAVPDISLSGDVDSLAQTLGTIIQKAGTRQGNINSILYALSAKEGVYDQPISTWTPANGLGVVNLEALLKAWPYATGSVTTTTTYVADRYTGSNGTKVTFTATVSPASLVGGATPSGTITFTSSLQGSLGSVSVSNYQGMLSITNLQAGTHTITATYNGDTNYAASTSAPSTFTITAATGTLTATLSPTSIGYGSTAAVDAVVKTASGTAPSGTVQAVVNNTTYTAALAPGTDSSTASITLDSPKPGSYPVVVSCVATTSLTCSNTVPLTLTVVKGTTTTALTVTPPQPLAGSQITLTANITGGTSTSTSLAAITGTVTFTDNGTLVGRATVTGGAASLTATLKSGKTHTLVATYSGDANWAGSASTAQTITPTPVTPTVTITANSLSPLAGANVTLTAKVSPPAGVTLFPTGTVKFYDSYNGTLRLLGTVGVASNGVDGSIAVSSSTGFGGGLHTVYAQYSGDDSFDTATSTNLAITAGDFTITMNPSSLTINRGQSGQAAAIVTVQGGFAGTTSVSCTPSAGTDTSCLVSPGTVTGAGTVTVTVSTTAPSATRRLAWTGKAAGGAVLAFLLCGWMPRRMKRLRGVLCVVMLLIVAASITGCASGVNSDGGSGGGGGGTGGTPLGASNFTITGAATDGSTVVRHSYSFQVNVQ